MTVVATTLMQRHPSCELAFDAVTRLHVLSAEGLHANWDGRLFQGDRFYATMTCLHTQVDFL